jgi:hypothetical protein
MAHSLRVGLVGDGVLLRRLVQPRGESTSGTKIARKVLPTYGTTNRLHPRPMNLHTSPRRSAFLCMLRNRTETRRKIMEAKTQ